MQMMKEAMEEPSTILHQVKMIYSFIDTLSRLTFSQRTDFADNYADVSGGAIFWDFNEPMYMTSSNYSGNSASIYGDNFASFARKLVPISEDSYNLQVSGGRR